MFKFNEVSSNANLLPEGEYIVRVVEAEYKFGKSSGVEYLSLTFETEENKKIWQIYNVFNPNDTARNIAMSDVKKILECQLYKEELKKDISKDQLLAYLKNGKKFKAFVIQVSDNFSDKNQIKKYYVLDESKDIPKESIPF